MLNRSAANLKCSCGRSWCAVTIARTSVYRCFTCWVQYYRMKVARDAA